VEGKEFEKRVCWYRINYRGTGKICMERAGRGEGRSMSPVERTRGKLWRIEGHEVCDGKEGRVLGGL